MANMFQRGDGTEGDMFGWSGTEDADERAQGICDEVRGAVAERTSQNYAEYKAVKYRNQTMCGGESFVIKVKVGEKDYIHLHVHRVTGTRYQQSPTLGDVQQNKTKDDPLEIPGH